MGRTAKEIIADIGAVRRGNKTLYEAMRTLVEGDDTTLRLIEAAYAIDPDMARYIHRQIAINDEQILILTRELCE